VAVRRSRISKEQQLVTWAELNHLRALDILPEAFEKAAIDTAGATAVYDVNGALLLWRVPLSRGRTASGYVDMAAHPALGEPLVAVAAGATWDADALVKAGTKAARALGLKEVDRAEARLVAYSFPKLALQFLIGKDEIAMLELHTWTPVPALARSPNRYEPPGHFERWSFLEEIPDEERAERTARFAARLGRWRKAFTQAPRDLAIVDSRLFIDRLRLARFLIRTRELHYSTRHADHVPCYELRGQQTNVWCVAASVQMLLDFYRYEYTQVRLAQELGLGTLTAPNGLPYSRDNDVVTVIEAMSRDALDAAMNTSPTFSEFVAEIDQNRPLISFVPGHSRTVAGYTRSFISVIGLQPFRGLLVYDPWPPDAGVITRWENFNATTYRRTFTARLRKA
jgi:hypothetical protein